MEADHYWRHILRPLAEDIVDVLDIAGGELEPRVVIAVLSRLYSNEHLCLAEHWPSDAVMDRYTEGFWSRHVAPGGGCWRLVANAERRPCADHRDRILPVLMEYAVLLPPSARSAVLLAGIEHMRAVAADVEAPGVVARLETALTRYRFHRQQDADGA